MFPVKTGRATVIPALLVCEVNGHMTNAFFFICKIMSTSLLPLPFPLIAGHLPLLPRVESVRVAWSEQLPPPDEASSPQFFDHPNRVIFHQYPTTSINNR